jgi:multiple sugar transport system substrate-binding protein
VKLLFTILTLSAFALAACSRVEPLLGLLTPAASPTTIPTSTVFPTVTATIPPSPTSAGPTLLRIWVPPQFDPDSGSPSGELLKTRLDEFSQQHPELRLEVRVKALSGPGGMLEALTTTSAAAPQALPDLVALSHEMLEAAALKGFVHSYGDQTDLKEGSDWYEYARQLAQLGNSVYGLPFASDMLALIYRPEKVASPPVDWSAALQGETPLVFPAAEPRALFTLALYQARGGAIQDSQGRPYLDAQRLEEVLTFFRDAQQLGVMPDWLTGIQSDPDAWVTFESGAADLVATWASNYLLEPQPDKGIAPLPTPDGAPFTLADGWIWALTSPDKGRLELDIELASFLVESNFLAEWTQAAGYLPPRPSALKMWTDIPAELQLDGIARSARMQPTAEILNRLGAPLEEAAVLVLDGQADPTSAARTAAEAVAGQ